MAYIFANSTNTTLVYMISLNIRTHNWADALANIKSQLTNDFGIINLEEHCSCGLKEMSFQSVDLGEGSFTGINFADGLSILWIHGRFKEDIELNQEFVNDMGLLRFVSSTTSEIVHYSTTKRLIYHLTPLSAGVRVGKSDNDRFILPSDEDILFTVVDLEGFEPIEHQDCIFDLVLPKLTKSIKQSEEEVMGKFFLGNHGLRVGDTVRDLIESTYESLARRAFIKGKAMEIISDHIHHFENLGKQDNLEVLLATQDIQQIQLAGRILVEELDSPLTISQLAKRVGMSQTALKKGFKLIFQMTIGQYLRKKRMYRALFLLQSTDMKISSVAAEVGYQHSGYFSKQFHAHFGVSPKQVKKTDYPMQKLTEG